MEGRRVRRFSRTQRHNNNTHLLPLHHLTNRLSNTLSCWYCDFKTSFFNEPLFRLGRNYSRFLRVWFSIGIGFSLTTMFGGFLILLWELVSLLHLYDENAWLGRILRGSFFGIPYSVFGLGISVTDAGYMCLSTIVAVCVHELGHAFAAASWGIMMTIDTIIFLSDKLHLAENLHLKCEKVHLMTGIVGITFLASSEGVQIEYIAVFLAVLFPGALVAFSYELLEALPSLSTLRIYCAGIWHNAVCCAFCGLALFMLPLILYPFYIHGESPMVLEVPTVSPLSDFLSPGDLITSLDGISIRDAKTWMNMAALVNGQKLDKFDIYGKNPMRVNRDKGYCVPNFMAEANKKFQLTDDRFICPNGFSAFATITCSNASLIFNGSNEDNRQEENASLHCLIPRDVVKLKKCSDGLVYSASNKNSCLCSEDETCLSPVQTRDSAWVEITYSSPYTSGCWHIEQNKSAGYKQPKFEEMGCGGAFVFIGDVISMAHSIRLTSYRPRWPFYFGVYVPSNLEKILVCTFNVSLALALLNSLPVYFLDGESILEASLSHFKLLSLRMQRRVVRLCLLGGTLVSVFAFLRILFFTVVST